MKFFLIVIINRNLTIALTQIEGLEDFVNLVNHAGFNGQNSLASTLLPAC